MAELQTVLGVDDMDRAVRFWSTLLDADPVPGQSSPRWTTLQSKDGAARLALQLSTVEPAHVPRVHVDVPVPDAAAVADAIALVEKLGGERVDWPHYPGDPDFVVLADSEGNRFCVIDESHPPADDHD